eukprot:scaffold5847_cov42-Phaeocystis_antarctica.AAC.3
MLCRLSSRPAPASAAAEGNGSAPGGVAVAHRVVVGGCVAGAGCIAGVAGVVAAAHRVVGPAREHGGDGAPLLTGDLDHAHDRLVLLLLPPLLPRPLATRLASLHGHRTTDPGRGAISAPIRRRLTREVRAGRRRQAGGGGVGVGPRAGDAEAG